SRVVQQIWIQHQLDMKDSRVYLCGSPEMVKQVRTRAYLAGAVCAGHQYLWWIENRVNHQC
ncbi:MAG: NAD(P)H-flavin reductase, partial [Candidatus Azotimanducaceae bacterium]